MCDKRASVCTKRETNTLRMITPLEHLPKGCVPKAPCRSKGALNVPIEPCTYWNEPFAKEPYKRDYVLQKRLIILRSLLIVATSYSVPKDLAFCQKSPVHTEMSPMYTQTSPMYTQKSPACLSKSPACLSKSPAYIQMSFVNIQRALLLKTRLFWENIGLKRALYSLNNSHVFSENGANGPVFSWTSPFVYQRSPLVCQKIPIVYENSPISYQKSPF